MLPAKDLMIMPLRTQTMPDNHESREGSYSLASEAQRVGMDLTQRLLLAVIIIEILVQLDIYLYYRHDIAEIGAVGGLNFSVTTLCLCALFFLISPRLVQKPPPSHLDRRLSLAAVCYLGVVCVSVLVASDMTLALFELGILLQAFLLYVYIVKAVRTRQDILFVVTMLLIGLALEGLVMNYLRIVGESISVGAITASVWKNSRVAGTIGAPNAAGSYLALLLPLALSVLLAKPSRGLKWLALLAFVLGVPALLFTLSRGAWIAFLVSMTYLFFAAWYHGKLLRAVPVAAASVLLIVAIFFHTTFTDRILGDDNQSAYSRIPLMKMALRMIGDHPVLGVGPNNYTVAMQHYISDFRGAWIHSVHNKYLLIWAETGVCGIVAFVCFLLATMQRGWQAGKSNDRLVTALAVGLSAGIAGHTVHMLADTFRGRPAVQMLWLVAGLLFAVSMVDKKADPDGSEMDPARS